MLRVLYIYRHPDMGYSIGRVFKPIEEEMKKYAEVDSIYLPVPNYSLRGLWKNISAALKAVKQKHYDIVHITGTEHYLIPFIHGQKVVVTVHDLGSLSINGNLFRSFIKKRLFINSLKGADGITFISQKTCDECNEMVRLDKYKQTVIGNPIDTKFQYIHKEFTQEQPVALHIGTKSNKNLHNTILALRGINCHLRIIGTLSAQDKTELSQNNIVHSNAYNLTDDEIIKEYINCDIVNFPSFYEGFGMPIIEGQAIGRLVITSDISPMNEVAGEGALLVYPNSVEEIRHSYLRLMNEPELRERLLTKGLENVKRFQIKYIAKQYLDIYKTFAKE